MQEKIVCPSYVLTAIGLLEKSGFKAFAVGGCVRDSLMGRIPDDWDMTTSAKPAETQAVFAEYRTVPTGLKHGTVTVIIEGHPLEITTMRIDGEYRDNRRPDSVLFTEEIEADLSRRDFTVNAMAYNPKTGLADPFGGRKDIERRLIRCVGEADRRFGEDALRIIRALRFSSVLGFEIESTTSESILKNYGLLDNVANERIRTELVKLLTGKNVENVLTDYKDVIFGIIPELRAEDGFLQHTPYHIYDVWTHTVKVTGAIEAAPVFRTAALLHDIAKPEILRIDENGQGHFNGHPQRGAEIAEKVMKRLKFSNAEIRTVCDMIRLHDERTNGRKNRLAHLCAEYSVDAVRNSLKLMRADAKGKNPEFYEIETGRCDVSEAQLDEIEKEGLCLKTRDLEADGNELAELGFRKQGIRAVLEALLDKVLDGEIPNEHDALIAEAKKMKNIQKKY